MYWLRFLKMESLIDWSIKIMYKELRFRITNHYLDALIKYDPIKAKYWREHHHKLFLLMASKGIAWK